MTDRQRTFVLLCCLTLIAFALRAQVALHSGLWADEGSFLQVIRAPSWNAMIEFLRYHESHPPLFYAVMRLWSYVAGENDTALLILPVLIGAAIVPALFVVASALYSRRAAIIAASLGVISALLVENSTQLRPYGVLALLALISSGSLIAAVVRHRRRLWITYFISTVIMLYTHNWAWVIVAGQFGAMAIEFIRHKGWSLEPHWRYFVLSWIAIFAAYAPWIRAFIFQTQHAGHGPRPITDLGMGVGYVVFSTYQLLETFFLGRLGNRHVIALVALLSATAALLVVARLERRARLHHPGDISILKSPASTSASMLILLIVAGSLAVALILSPHNNLLLPRCLSALMPLLLVVFGGWLDTVIARCSTSLATYPAAALVGFLTVTSTFELYELAVRSRSNAREIAAIVKAQLRPDDLLVMAPEWYSASFNHYFPPSIDQIDFPHSGRVTMIDFADVWKSRKDPTAVARFESRIDAAQRAGRRVWLIVEPKYFKSITAADIATADKYHQPGPLSIRIVHIVRASLECRYGPPEKVFGTSRPKPVYDDLRAYLFVPGPAR
jgi:hypothetical protein